MAFGKITDGLRSLFRKTDVDREMDDEVRGFVEEAAREKMKRGMSREEALREARVEISGVESVKEGVRSFGWESIVGNLWQDLRFGARTLRKNPGFTAVAILTLALGIGPNTAMFSVLDAVLLRPLPYPRADRLVVIGEVTAQHRKLSVSYPDFEDWEHQQDVFGSLAFYRAQSLNFTGIGEPEHLRAGVATAAFFSTLGLQPILGRSFNLADDAAGSPPVVVLSFGFWQQQFGADPEIIGRPIRLDELEYTIVGVLSNVPSVPRNAQLWTNFGLQAARPELHRRANHMGYSVLARLNPGASMPQARAEMEAIASRIAAANPETNTGTSIRLDSMLDTMVGSYRTELILLAAAVGLVLLIACANLANLLYARGVTRDSEFAIRAALGAARSRLARQLLTENLLLAMLGGTAGLLLAYASRGAIVSLTPAGAARFPEARIDLTVLAFAFSISLLTGILFGLAPARRLSRAKLRDTMLQSGRASSENLGRAGLRRLLISAEVALTLMLLASAALFLQSLRRTESAKLGFDPNHLLMLNLDLSGSRYATAAQINAFYDQLLDRVRTLPGVTGATLDSAAPLDTNWQTSFDIEGAPPFAPGQAPSEEISVVAPDYFRVMGVPVLAGRGFTKEDAAGPPVMVIDEAFAHHFWSGKDAIGKHVIWGRRPKNIVVTIVGVVPTVKLYGYTEQPRLLQAYFPESQIGETHLTLLVRAQNDPAPLAEPIRRVVFDLDPTQPVYSVRTLEQDLRDSIGSARLMVSLLGIFAALALVMAGGGLYGVVSYNVSRRRREIGIRVALGADPRQVLWMVLAHGLQPAVLGIALGVVGTLAASRIIADLLYETGATNPITLGCVSFLLLLVVLAASYVPARRTLGLDPVHALRQE
jgi:putative ABC transport system permease protein